MDLDEVVPKKMPLPSPERCKRLREAAGLRQQDLAEAIGVRREAVSHWENGATLPRAMHLMAYAAIIEHLEREVSLPEETTLPPVNERIRLRRAGGLSQSKAAELLGLTQPWFQGYEVGRIRPTGERLSRYVELLSRWAEGGADVAA